MSAARRQDVIVPSAKLDGLGLRGDRVALGLAGVGGAWGAVDERVAHETVQRALDLGVRVFDAAPSYGNAEKILGETLRRWTGEPLVVSTKVGRLPARDGLEIRFDYSNGSMRDSLRRSLDVIGVPQIDLLFLHEPDFVPPAERPRVVDALRQFQADGLVRHLGIGGGHGDKWDGLVETGAFAVVMLFRRIDACVLDGCTEDVPRLERLNVALYGASPLHMGLLGARYEEFIRERPSWVWPASLERATRLKRLAEDNGLSLATLAHRFAFSIAALDRVVIGARTATEINDAFSAYQAGPLNNNLFNAVMNH